MTYVSVKEETEERLHLSREPSSRAWAILIGLISLGLGAAYYSVDFLLWKFAYVSGAAFVGLSCMEDWEECILDKKEGKVTVKRTSLLQKLFRTAEGQKSVVGNLGEIIEVKVEEDDVRYSGTGYVVVLLFASGYSIGVTETATMGDKSEHEQVAQKIYQFLQLDQKQSQGSTPLSEGPISDPLEPDSSSSDESFEQIEKSDIPGSPTIPTAPLATAEAETGEEKPPE